MRIPFQKKFYVINTYRSVSIKISNFINLDRNCLWFGRFPFPSAYSSNVN